MFPYSKISFLELDRIGVKGKLQKMCGKIQGKPGFNGNTSKQCFLMELIAGLELPPLAGGLRKSHEIPLDPIEYDQIPLSINSPFNPIIFPYEIFPYYYLPIWNIPIFCSHKSPWCSMVKCQQIRHKTPRPRGKIRGDLWRRRRRPPRFTCIWQMPWIAPWSMKTWWITLWINGILWWFNGI